MAFGALTIHTSDSDAYANTVLPATQLKKRLKNLKNQTTQNTQVYWPIWFATFDIATFDMLHTSDGSRISANSRVLHTTYKILTTIVIVCFSWEAKSFQFHLHLRHSNQDEQQRISILFPNSEVKNHNKTNKQTKMITCLTNCLISVWPTSQVRWTIDIDTILSWYVCITHLTENLSSSQYHIDNNTYLRDSHCRGNICEFDTRFGALRCFADRQIDTSTTLSNENKPKSNIKQHLQSTTMYIIYTAKLNCVATSTISLTLSFSIVSISLTLIWR